MALFSFGNSAIFLLGGRDLDTKPIALLLESGDILIMSKESRLNYHGVPRIIFADSRPWDFNTDVDLLDNNAYISEMFDKQTLKKCRNEFEWKPFSSYCEDTRININVRQVLNKGQRIFIS